MLYVVKNGNRIAFSDGRGLSTIKILSIVERPERNLVDVTHVHELRGYQRTASLVLDLHDDWDRQRFLLCVHEEGKVVKAFDSEFNSLVSAQDEVLNFNANVDQVIAVETGQFICANSFHDVGLIDNVFALNRNGQRIWRIHDSIHRSFGTCSYDEGIGLAAPDVVSASGKSCGTQYINIATGERFATIEEAR